MPHKTDEYLTAVAPALPTNNLALADSAKLQEIASRRFPGFILRQGRTTAEAMGDLIDHILTAQQQGARAKGR